MIQNYVYQSQEKSMIFVFYCKCKHFLHQEFEALLSSSHFKNFFQQYYIIIMIHQSEQERVDAITLKIDEIKKMMKMYGKYLSEVELDLQNKKGQSIVKQYQSQIIISNNDPSNIALNLSETFNLFEHISKIFVQQQQDFLHYQALSFDEFNEKFQTQSKKIIDGNSNNLKALAAARQSYRKAKEKYEKNTREIDLAFQDRKRNLDAKTGYNVQLSDKSQLKLKDMLRQVLNSEQSFKDAAEAVTTKTKEFQDGLQESYKHLKVLYKQTCEKFIEITMKYDQHNLLSFNWSKGYQEDKSEKILTTPKFDQNEENKLIQSKCEQVLISDYQYSQLIAKIIDNENLTDQEYMQFTDITQKYVEIQISLIQDRVKTYKLLYHFVTDFFTNCESVQKQLLKLIKLNSEKFGDLSPKFLSIIQETLTSFHESYSKRSSSLTQFNLAKANAIDALIKDQKAQERSFMNMYQKIIKDILQIKSQIQQDNQDRKLLSNYKKIIHESSPILNYSLGQVRSVEYQRIQNILEILEQILKQQIEFVDENIKNIKTQEEYLNQKYDTIEQEIDQLPQMNLATEPQSYPFVQVFQLHSEIQSYLDQHQQNFEDQQNELKQDDDDDKNLEEGAVKVSQSLLTKFKVVEGEKCLASYACAFDNKILLQGRMYIFSFRICFHSYFNAKTLFGKTILVIPASEIQYVRKSKSYLIDNAIEFQTIKGHLVFTSFINRESTVNQIKQVKGLAECFLDEKERSQSGLEKSAFGEEDSKMEENYEEQSPLKNPSRRQSVKNLSVEKKKQKPLQEQQVLQEQQDCRAESPKREEVAEEKKEEQCLYRQVMVSEASVRHMNNPNVTKFATELKLTPKEVITQLFLDQPRGQYKGFFEYFQAEYCKDKEIQYEPYQPPFDWSSIHQPFKRAIHFLHPVREKSMFAPDFAQCSTFDTLFIFSDKEALQEKEVTFRKIPYGDHFKFYSFYHIKEKDQHTHIQYGFYVQFLKKTILQRKIESSTKAENKETWEKGVLPFLKQEEKRLKPQLREEEEEKKSTVQEEQSTTNEEKKVEQLERKVAILEKKVDQLNSLVYTLFGMMVLSLVLNRFYLI